MTFVSFPNTGTDYLFTNDVNVFDADSAHSEQALQWKGYATGGNAVTAVTQSTDVPPVFGTYTVKIAVTTAAGAGRAGIVPISTFRTAALASTLYTFSVSIYSDTAFTGELGAEDYEEGYGYLSGSFNTAAFSHTGSGWERFGLAHTTHSNTDASSFYIYDASPTSTHTFYCDAFQYELGTLTDFVPSLDIRGSLFEEKSESGLTAVLAADVLKVGASFDGDGYYYRRYDGADNTAPLVCEFLAADVLAVL